MGHIAAARLRARGVFFGWWIVGAAIVFQTLQSGLLQQAYGTYAVVLHDEFGWSTTSLSIVYALQSVLTGVLGPAQGWLIDRFSPRTVMRAGALIFGFGFLALSRIDSFAGFCIIILITSFGATLAGFMTVTTVVVNWFQRRRALAMALTQIGLSIAGLIAPVIAWSLTSNGWRTTAVASGVIILLVNLPLARVLRRTPEEVGQLPDGDRPLTNSPERINANLTTVQPEFTARQALRTRAFWFISIGHALALFVVTAVTVHLVLHLVDDLDYTVGQAANVIALMTGIMIFGRFAGGILGDRFEKRYLAAAAMFGHAFGLVMLAYANSFWMVLLFALAHGMAWGIRGPLMQAMRADYFGRASFAKVMGFSSTIIMTGTVGGPLIAGVMADHFGNYTAGFTLLASFAVIGSI
ncbi:MAG TPA: MFS transporter, partial [Nitrolancea sp.]